MDMAVWAGKGILFATLLIGASYCDIRSREVPDIYSVFIIVTALFLPDVERWYGLIENAGMDKAYDAILAAEE